MFLNISTKTTIIVWIGNEIPKGYYIIEAYGGKCVFSKPANLLEPKLYLNDHWMISH